MTDTAETIEYEFPAPMPIQAEELDILEHRDKISVADWALTKRKLSAKTTKHYGDWSHEYTPFMVRPMEWLSDASTRQLNIMACAQGGKTEVGLNFLGHTVDEDPAPFMMVMPRETDTISRVKSRIRPMFESTPSLREHLTGGKLDAINSGTETELDNMILFNAWAGSPAALADKAICKGWADEAGKFPRKVKDEADALGLFKKRFTTYRDEYKFLNTSTPVLKGDTFDREYSAGLEYLWYAKCVHCSEHHVQVWANYQLDKDDEGKLLDSKVYEAGGHCRYACPICGAIWTEQERWVAVSEGQYVPEGCTIDKDGNIHGQVPIVANISVRISGFMLYPGFKTADDLAAEWAEAIKAKKTGDIEPLQNFINSTCGEPWEEKEKETAEDQLRPHIGSYAPEVVPHGCQILIAAFDVQLDHIWVTVDGWGHLSEAWSIYEGRLETGSTLLLENYNIVRKFLSSSWPTADDPSKKMGIYIAGMDSGYRTDVVYDFCRSCTDVKCVPTMGDHTVKKQTYRASKVAGGTQTRYDINVTVYKDRLYRLLYESQSPGPGYYHLHRDTTEETLRHLTSEDKQSIRKGKLVEHIWLTKNKHHPNHLWDTKVIGAFLADLVGARQLPDPDVQVAPPQRRYGQKDRR